MDLLCYPLNNVCLLIEMREMFEVDFLNNINPNLLRYILSFSRKMYL